MTSQRSEAILRYDIITCAIYAPVSLCSVYVLLARWLNVTPGGRCPCCSNPQAWIHSVFVFNFDLGMNFECSQFGKVISEISC
uniref:Uncharacterized protein n=1 Tax=Anguilla anguilla TaxID=7936 RepID=A0A0E9WQ54_ANGAN